MAQIGECMNSTNNGKKDTRTYSKHGLTSLKAAVKGLGGRVIDRRTTLGKALAQWRASLVLDLGGNDAISTQRGALIDLCVKSKLILDSIDAWILTQPSLINARRRSLLPVVRERQALADGLAKYLKDLGLERRAKKIDLSDELAKLDTEEKKNQG